ncbi:hypothetical protein H4S08_002291 [Coemansia sp. RSA 1365]|nr:hypothetical protein H4S08_002291 [Coemansia sp. RSA 1365]
MPKATATESPPAQSPLAKQSPSTGKRAPSVVAHSLPAIRSPTVPSLQPMPLHPPPQQHQPVPPPYHYDSLAGSGQPHHYDSLAGSAPQQTQYHSHPPLPPLPQVQDGSQQHLAGYTQATGVQASTAPGISTMPARFLSAATTSTQQHQQLPTLGPHSLGLIAHSAPLAASASTVSGPTAATASTPSAQLPQSFVSPHGIPTSLLGHGSAVANAEYGVWFYPHHHLVQADRGVGMGGMAGSASASPLSQHTIASTDQSYPLQGQFDTQMRYMAVPGQPSGAPKPMVSAALPIDRSLRPISIASQQQQQQHGLASMHYSQSPVYQNHGQYHPSYYHPQHQMPPQSLHPSIIPNQSQHPQHHPPFPAQPSALAATAPMSECSSTHTSVGCGANGSVMHPSAYGAMHPPSIDSVSGDQVSAAQVAAAVAAAAVSAHSIPVSNTAVGVGAGASGSASSSAIGFGGSRLAAGANDPEQQGIPAFKFSMSMPTNSESNIPEYFESYSQGYMMGNAPIMEPSPASPAEQTLDAELMARLDGLFMKYLEAICSNNITVDSEGESIHQTQMAKKLEKLEQCAEYRTFRFRIQAFSNGFREFIEREAGLTEQAVSKQQLRNYLHQQHYISRYNEDGKKAKSKGHHVWNVEAKKMSRNTWWFKEFVRRIAAPPPKAIAGVPYEWTPTIWDPQIKAPKVYFSSEWLPPWLRWENNTLRGLPPVDAADCSVGVVASYYQGKEVCHFKSNFTIHVMPHTPSGNVFLP